MIFSICSIKSTSAGSPCTTSALSRESATIETVPVVVKPPLVPPSPEQSASSAAASSSAAAAAGHAEDFLEQGSRRGSLSILEVEHGVLAAAKSRLLGERIEQGFELVEGVEVVRSDHDPIRSRRNNDLGAWLGFRFGFGRFGLVLFLLLDGFLLQGCQSELGGNAVGLGLRLKRIVIGRWASARLGHWLRRRICRSGRRPSSFRNRR